MVCGVMIFEDFLRSFSESFHKSKKRFEKFQHSNLVFLFGQPKQSSIHSSINHLFGIFLVLFDSNKQTNIRQINSEFPFFESNIIMTKFHESYNHHLSSTKSTVVGRFGNDKYNNNNSNSSSNNRLGSAKSSSTSTSSPLFVKNKSTMNVNSNDKCDNCTKEKTCLRTKQTCDKKYDW